MGAGFVKTILNRVNTINGRTNKNDPTIMAWVRCCRRCCCCTSQRWKAAVLGWARVRERTAVFLE